MSISQRVKERVDIVDLISSYVKLTKSGRNYIGLCPFHDDRNPSFTVSPDKQIFHCFGCHAGGNVFSFIQQYEKISFVDAVKKWEAGNFKEQTAFVTRIENNRVEAGLV